MKRSVGTPLALFGLLLAAAMVCTTSAQGPEPSQKPDASTPNPFAPRLFPKPEAPAVDPAAPVSTRQEPRPDDPAGDHSVLPGRTREIPPTRSRSARPNTPSVRSMPLVVGRYQAVSHNGELILLDTATGECLRRRNETVWENFAAPIVPNAVPTLSSAPPSP
jgi:hypothetical protein